MNIAGKTLEEWQALARTDRCLDQMVPSDVRSLLKVIMYQEDEIKWLTERLEREQNRNAQRGDSHGYQGNF